MFETSLVQILPRICRPRILVVGDAILDEYVWGVVERTSPEAPIPVLRVQRQEERLGGAASVVANLAKLGADVSLMSMVGDDAQGEMVLRFLQDLGSRSDMVARVSGIATTVKARHLGSVQHADRAVQQLLRVDTEDLRTIPRETAGTLLSRLRECVSQVDVVLISDYQKGFLEETFLRGIFDIAGTASVPILVDPARIRSYTRYRGAYLVCPNRYETSLATGLPCQNPVQSREAAEKLVGDFGFECVAVTMDRDGIFLYRSDGTARHFTTQATIVSDVTGAGDMVLSILGLAIGGGCSVESAIRLANVAAGIEIRRIGATPIAREELLAELVYQGHTGAIKIKTMEELVSRTRDLRENGNRIVFTNGCFDLLHFGHHHLLSQARRMGDCLIVAVNSDASIRRLKGGNRPVNTQEERMLMLSGLESVDFVVLFDEDTPMSLLRALHPDVLVKGSDYREGVVVGRDFVESYGGRVALVDMVPGISTTSILEGEYNRSRTSNTPPSGE